MRSPIAGLAILIPLTLAGCGAREAMPAEEAAASTVSVVHPERGDVVRTITLSGDVVALNQSALYAKVTGYLKSIAVDKGDWVRKGQVLAEIEVPELEQKLRRARASLGVRRVTYDRLRGVWQTDRRLVAREDVDVAQGAFEQAAADVEELEALLAYTHIVAPFDGVVTARFVDPGALIQASGHASLGDGADGGGEAKGTPGPVLTVADIGTLRVYIYVPEQETSAIKQGLPATLRLREFPGRQFTGTVTRFATSLDLSTRTMLTEVDLDNARHELYPGMYAGVTLELIRHRGVVKVPAAAIAHSGDDAFVFAVKDGTVVKIPVTPGLDSGGTVEVQSGLAGDEVVVSPFLPALTAGQKVRIRSGSASREATRVG
jgi:membrane fusion protein, multidrug efflux system